MSYSAHKICVTQSFTDFGNREKCSIAETSAGGFTSKSIQYQFESRSNKVWILVKFRALVRTTIKEIDTTVPPPIGYNTNLCQNLIESEV